MKIDNVNIQDLKWYKNNNKSHPAKQVEMIANSIKQFWFKNPIIIDKNNEIIAWHGRLLWAKQLWMETVPCIIADDLTEEQVRAYRLLDNKIWDFGAYDIENIIAELWDVGDCQLGLESLDKIFADLLPEEETKKITEDDYKLPEEIKTDIVLWDLFEIWEHRLLCGDSTKKEDVAKLMNGEKADMVFTDPPYNTGMSEKSNSGSTRLNHMFNDSYTDSERQLFMESFLERYNESVNDNTALYICLDWRRNYELIPNIKKHFALSNIIVWDKVVHWLWSDYKYTYEVINVCKKWKPVIDSHQWEDREYSDVWHIQRKIGKDEDHATKKPIELCARAIRHASNKWSIVLDLFGWSWSTMVASHWLSRVCYMQEYDPKYCQVILDRMIKLDPTLQIKKNWLHYNPISND